MTEFKPVSFTDGAVDLTRLQQLANNQQALYEQKIPIKYQRGNFVKVGGLKIASGIVTLGATSKIGPGIDVYFGAFFTPGCLPSVQLTYSTNDYRQVRVHILAKGLGNGVLDPDHRGMQVLLLGDPIVKTTSYFPTFSRVHWTAIGW